jgi:hypothetical protein
VEEILHLVTQKGYSRLFHELDDFKGTTGNVLSDAMDAARGGRFPGGFPVEHYPEGAWYSYNDVTCTYGCQKTEYLCVSPQQTRFTSPTSHVSHASRLPHLPHLTSFHVSFSLPAAGTGCSHPISGAKAMARVAPGTSRSIMNGSSQPGSYCCTVMATATALISWAWRCWCDKRASFWSHFQIENTIDLPRQARDKHNREGTLQKKTRFSQEDPKYSLPLLKCVSQKSLNSMPWPAVTQLALFAHAFCPQSLSTDSNSN